MRAFTEGGAAAAFCPRCVFTLSSTRSLHVRTDGTNAVLHDEVRHSFACTYVHTHLHLNTVVVAASLHARAAAVYTRRLCVLASIHREFRRLGWVYLHQGAAREVHLFTSTRSCTAVPV